jgi:hypothetical protein
VNKLVGGLIPLVRFHRYVYAVDISTVVEVVWLRRSLSTTLTTPR